MWSALHVDLAQTCLASKAFASTILVFWYGRFGRLDQFVCWNNQFGQFGQFANLVGRQNLNHLLTKTRQIFGSGWLDRIGWIGWIGWLDRIGWLGWFCWFGWLDRIGWC